MRDTQLSATSLVEVLETAMKADQFESLKGIKIASVVADDSIRTFIAGRMSSYLQLKGIDHQVFHDIAAAEEWLAG